MDDNLNDEYDILENDSTQLAHERTFLANERTFIAWLRTGLALAGAGLGIVKFLDSEGPRWLMRTMGMLLVMTGQLSYLIAYWRYKGIRKKLCNKNVEMTPSWILIPLSLSLLVMSVVSIAVIVSN